jgi:glycosyltransferase A (GT-A) superfamily protein (DUF2064 family)
MTYRSRRAPRYQRKRGCHLLVMAKAPVPGKVKTRLCPRLTPAQAAEVAAAALADTLEAVAGCNAERKILALDGRAGDWLPAGFEVIAQRGRAFDERLASAWSDAAGPGLQIGMDTPQITSELLDHCLDVTFQHGATASLGRAADGGWWAIGLSDRWDTDVFTGVPMSTPATAAIQLMRLGGAGHRVAHLPWLTDVDDIGDALRVAAQATGSRFPSVMRGLLGQLGGVA